MIANDNPNGPAGIVVNPILDPSRKAIDSNKVMTPAVTIRKLYTHYNISLLSRDPPMVTSETNDVQHIYDSQNFALLVLMCKITRWPQ
jgi:hypothetical protein